MSLRELLAVGLLAAIGTAGNTALADVDWNDFTDVEEVSVVTTDEDGEIRETTIWIIVVDGAAYIRTGSTRWGRNVERDPGLILHVEGREIPVEVDFVTDEALRDRLVAIFREKYGFSDAFISLFRGSNPKIMHLTPREQS